MSYYLLAVDRDSDGLEILNSDHGLEVWIFNDIDELFADNNINIDELTE